MIRNDIQKNPVTNSSLFWNTAIIIMNVKQSPTNVMSNLFNYELLIILFDKLI